MSSDQLRINDGLCQWARTLVPELVNPSVYDFGLPEDMGWGVVSLKGVAAITSATLGVGSLALGARAANAESPAQQIVVIGDSITTGLQTGGLAQAIEAGDGRKVVVLDGRVSRAAESNACDQNPASTACTDLPDGIRVIDMHADEIQAAQVVVLGVGTNDPVNVYANHATNLILHAEAVASADGTPASIVVMNYMGDSGRVSADAKNLQLNEVVAGLQADGVDARVLDLNSFYDSTLAPKRMVARDGIHLKADGYSLTATYIADQLLNLVPPALVVSPVPAEEPNPVPETPVVDLNPSTLDPAIPANDGALTFGAGDTSKFVGSVMNLKPATAPNTKTGIDLNGSSISQTPTGSSSVLPSFHIDAQKSDSFSTPVALKIAAPDPVEPTPKATETPTTTLAPAPEVPVLQTYNPYTALTTAQLAQAILDADGNTLVIADAPNDRVRESLRAASDDGITFTHNIGNTDEVPLARAPLEIVLALSNLHQNIGEDKIVINSITTGNTHSDTSNHYNGSAIDLGFEDPEAAKQLYDEIYQRRGEFGINELILANTPNGEPNLLHGQPHTYSQETLAGHVGHIHLSAGTATLPPELFNSQGVLINISAGGDGTALNPSVSETPAATSPDNATGSGSATDTEKSSNGNDTVTTVPSPVFGTSDKAGRFTGGTITITKVPEDPVTNDKSNGDKTTDKTTPGKDPKATEPDQNGTNKDGGTSTGASDGEQNPTGPVTDPNKKTNEDPVPAEEPKAVDEPKTDDKATDSTDPAQPKDSTDPNDQKDGKAAKAADPSQPGEQKPSEGEAEKGKEDPKPIPEIIYEFFRKEGFTDAGALGIMASMAEESGLNPRRAQNNWHGRCAEPPDRLNPGTLKKDGGTHNYGFGLLQWTPDGRQNPLQAYADKKGTSWQDLETQLEFVVKELTEGYPGLLALLKATTDPREAARVFVERFVRPGVMVPGSKWYDPEGAEKEKQSRSDTAEALGRKIAADKFSEIDVACD